MGKDLGGGAETGVFEFRRPEQSMEVNNIFADKMVNLGSGILFPIIQPVDAIFIAVVF